VFNFTLSPCLKSCATLLLSRLHSCPCDRYLELAVDPLEEGLAVLLVGADGLDVVLGEALELLLYLPYAQLVVVVDGEILGILAAFLASSVLGTYCSPRFEPSRFFLSVCSCSSSLMFSQACFGR
jgi:hypothetical protein